MVDKVGQTLIVPQVGMAFESEEKAVDMYYTYAGIVGFSIQKGHSKLRGDETLSNKYIVCSKENVCIAPPTYGGGLHNPPTYKMVYITPLNFSKPVKLRPKAVLKNHSKSQKNHKIKNLIVLDSKWVDLHSEYIIWYDLVYFFVVALDLWFSS